jgi:hypothetical protein
MALRILLRSVIFLSLQVCCANLPARFRFDSLRNPVRGWAMATKHLAQKRRANADGLRKVLHLHALLFLAL